MLSRRETWLSGKWCSLGWVQASEHPSRDWLEPGRLVTGDLNNRVLGTRGVWDAFDLISTESMVS